VIVILVSTVDIVKVTPKLLSYTSVAVEIGSKEPTAKLGYFPAMSNLVLMEEPVEMMKWIYPCTTAIVQTVTLERIAKSHLTSKLVALGFLNQY